jgi:Na+-driven multidrug efflux pump
MIVTGFGQGASPLISFTYGAKEFKLAESIRRKTNMFVLCAGVIVILAMVIISDWYSGIFIKNETVEGMVRTGIWIFTLSFLFTGINTITTFYFTSIGRAKEAVIISSLRGLIVLLICIFTLPILFGMTGVWLVAPVTETITVLVCICFICKNDMHRGSVINPAKEEREPYAASR